MIKKITPTLLVSAILSLFAAIWRFESVASEVKQIKSQVENHYTKKEEFISVKLGLSYLKEKQEDMDKKLDIILQAVKR